MAEGFPVFYVGKDLRGTRQRLRKGDPWPWQDRRIIRGWSEAFGVPDDGRAWDKLSFVRTLLAPSEAVAQQIAGLPYDAAVRYLKELER